MVSDTADWVAAIGQVAGAVGSFAAVVVAFWIGRRDGRRARAELEARDAAQAWLLVSRVVSERGRRYVRTTNHSERLFFDITVTAVAGADRDVHVVAEDGAPAVIEVLGPGQVRDRLLGGVVTDAGPVSTTYRDATGLLWQRDGTSPPRRRHPARDTPRRRWRGR